MQYWAQNISEICELFKSDPEKGLAQSDATSRLEEHGPNELPKKSSVIWWKLLFEQFSSLIIWMLIAAAVIAASLGELIDAIAIIAIVILNAFLGFFQEYRAERSLEALQKLASPMSKVFRDGDLQTLPSNEIVPGDLVLLEAGDRVPADGRILNTSHLSVDEASLTGESVPVSKTSNPLSEDLPLGDRTNMAFLGTTVVAGKGLLLITDTGLKTQMGKIASELLVQKKEATPLQKQLDKLGKKLVFLCLAIVAIVFALGVFRGNPLIDMLLISMSLAVAAIPEGLPAAVTIALSIGVRKMAEQKALIRRLSSVETLGSTNVICTDKTGTLTQNAMTVREVWTGGQNFFVTGSGYSPEGAFQKDEAPINPAENPSLELSLKIGTLCNSANIVEKEGNWIVVGDPTEGALLTAAAKANLQKGALEEAEPLTEELPFDSDRKMMSMIRGPILYAKGAPDVILARSNSQYVNGEETPLTEADKEAILKANSDLASKAYRVLAVAYQKNKSAPNEEDLIFVGLIAMIDPPRPEVLEAIQSCTQAGIHTVMATGDHKVTALAIAKELQMPHANAIDGTELDQLSDEQLMQRLEDTSIFSRISAEHKFRLVGAYKSQNLVTAMTGDGVNDAPAIHAADIGISMGITGTEVTKESSDMVILDDNFASIVRAIEQGRGIYDNIVKFVSYLLSSNIAEILVIFLTMLLGLKGPDGTAFVALLPIQLLWMNLVTDGFPAISLAMDPPDPRIMTKKPRPRSQAILHKRLSLLILTMSLLVTAGALIACFYGLRTSIAHAQTMTFTTLILLQLVRVQMIRRQYLVKLFSNPFLIVSLVGSFLLQLLVVYVPAFQVVFGTAPLNLGEWAVIFGISFTTWWVGLLITKLFYK